jgi:hypothetical protein
MDTLTILLTRHPLLNLPATAIRAALPHAAGRFGLASHAMVVDGDSVIEARMLWMDGARVGSGVRRIPRAVALSGAQVVAERAFSVPDATAGLAFCREQIGKSYDFRGALGLVRDPMREWAQDDCWFCFELAAATLHAAGRLLFERCGHITGRELLSVRRQ